MMKQDIIAEKEEALYPTEGKEQRVKQELENTLQLHTPSDLLGPVEPHCLTFRISPCQASSIRDYVLYMSLDMTLHIQTTASSELMGRRWPLKEVLAFSQH